MVTRGDLSTHSKGRDLQRLLALISGCVLLEYVWLWSEREMLRVINAVDDGGLDRYP